MPMPRRIIQRGLVVDEIRVRLAEMGYPLFGSWNPKTRPSSGGGGVAVLLLVAFVVALACGLGDYLDRSEFGSGFGFCRARARRLLSPVAGRGRARTSKQGRDLRPQPPRRVDVHRLADCARLGLHSEH